MLSIMKRHAKRFRWFAHRYRQWRDAAFERVEPQVTPLGFRLSGQRDMMSGTFEPAETAMIRKLVGSIDVVVDVGANIGYYVCHALQSNPECRVVALEPCQPTCATCSVTSKPTAGIIGARSCPLLSLQSRQWCRFMEPELGLLSSEGGMARRTQARCLCRRTHWGISSGIVF